MSWSELSSTSSCSDICVCAVYMYIMIMSPWILYVHVWYVLLCTCMCIYLCIYHIHILHPANMNIYCYTYIYIYIHVSIWEQAPENKIFWEKKKRQSTCSMHFFQRFIGSSWAWNLLPICNSLVPRWKTHFPSRRERMHTVGAPTKWAKYDSLQHSM